MPTQESDDRSSRRETRQLAKQVADAQREQKEQREQRERRLRTELSEVKAELASVQKSVERLQKRARVSPQRSALRYCGTCGAVCVRYDPTHDVKCPNCRNGRLQPL